MPMRIKSQAPSRRPRRGTMIPLAAVMLPVLLILSSFVVNQSYQQLTRTELQIVADAASRAAGQTLIRTRDQARALDAAQQGGWRNRVGGEPAHIDESDVQFGVATRKSLDSRYAFQADAANPNAVRVEARPAEAQPGALRSVLSMYGDPGGSDSVQTSVSAQSELDIALVVDRCGQDGSVDRQREVAAAVDVLLELLSMSPQREQVALVLHKDEPIQSVPLTEDYSQIVQALAEFAKSAEPTSKRGPSCAGIEAGVEALGDAERSRPWAAKIVIVLSDKTTAAEIAPANAAQYAFDRSAAIYAVTYNDQTPSTPSAEVVGCDFGLHVRAGCATALKDAFARIGHQLPTLLTE